ncbi:nucleolar protein 58-like [Anoplophora glabripennis]|uniref:nucleolar protein 58-like n=1 Tax=Anoplophora glabripennis TaxID=217634 RepID=UPI000C78B860|nr:nucleolar protein 58-like [Anoplophora glabripennis]
MSGKLQINKSMAQRMKAKQNYDATIEEIEEKYKRLKENSGDLMTMVAKDCNQLDSLINKKTSTEDTVASPVDEDAQTETSEKPSERLSEKPSEKPSEKSSERVSSTSSAKTSQEECVCLPNKDGRCIREKMASKMIQASSVQSEVPTKLEKEASEEKNQQKESDSKQNEERSAQTFVTGEPEIDSDEDEEIAFEKKKSRLSHAANQYKETSLRRSQ